MRTRLNTPILLLCLLALAGDTYAQGAKWDTFRYEKWGFALQLPAGASKQELPSPPESGACDVYSIGGGLACVIQITTTPDDALASTVIEQAIQSETKPHPTKPGPTKRWEQTSKQGELFKGFAGQVQLKTDDAVQAAVSKIIGGERGTESTSLAPLGDESAPVLRVAVFGPANRESDIATAAKGIAALVSRSQTKPPVPLLRPTPAPRPRPRPAPKPWPMLKKGEIELSGTVETISNDRKTVILTVDTVKMPGQEPIALSPARSKKVLLRSKLEWLAEGLYVHLIGKDTGVGKPIPADAMEQAPVPAPKPVPLGPLPLT